jgi:[protein-PII] uridylyltransferase
MDRPSSSNGLEPELCGKRTIVDRAALRHALSTLTARKLSAEQERAGVVAALKAALSKGQAEVRRRLEAGAPGIQVVRDNCFLIDQVVRLAHDHVTQHLFPLANPTQGERLALVAVGGYGRGEMAPHSDVDLLFLLPYKLTPYGEQVIEAILYLLWDLGFKVGQATRSIDECLRLAKEDVTIRTALLEARFLWGDQALFVELKERFQKTLQARSGVKFIEAKLAERATRHERFGNSRYVLEPNIKDGKGGLRDLQTLYWIAKYLYQVDDIAMLVERDVFSRQEVRRFEKAHNFLWTLRCHLHYLAGRPEERLTFDLQKQIAPRLGYTAHAGAQDVERFMKHYFLVAKDVGDLTRIFCAVLEVEHKRAPRFRLLRPANRRRVAGFRVEGDRLTVEGPEVFAARPMEMLRIFLVAQEHGLDIHPHALRWITRHLGKIDKTLRDDPEANQIFLRILTSHKDPEIALRRLNEAGVFGRFVPDFGRVVAQMQYNMYHHFTVDEHTIFAIGVLHDIEQGRLKAAAPIATEVVHKVLSRKVLYLAVLLHDIAKGRPGDHSEVGAKIAQRLCPRLGLSAEQTETVAWLVRYHLAMSATAFKRDIDDPQTIETFAELVQSAERLRLLLVLTVADIRAVGPNTWNSWKAALLRELYWRTEELLSGAMSTQARDARVKAAKEALAQALDDWPKKDLSAHLARGYPSYWLSFDTKTHLRHARLLRTAAKSGDPLTVDTRVDRYREATEVTIYAADHAGLFSRIAGAMAVAGASIDAARIFTLKNGMALDSFYVRSVQGGPFDRPNQLARLSTAIEQTLSGRLKPLQELARLRSPIPSRLRVFRVEPRVLIDNKASATHTLIEVNGRDRPGLLYQVTLALTKLQLMIHSAKISTFGERAVDVFYVQNALGDKVESEARLKRIRERLLEALAEPEDKPAQAEKKTTKKMPVRKAAKKPTAKAPRAAAR